MCSFIAYRCPHHQKWLQLAGTCNLAKARRGYCTSSYDNSQPIEDRLCPSCTSRPTECVNRFIRLDLKFPDYALQPTPHLLFRKRWNVPSHYLRNGGLCYCLVFRSPFDYGCRHKRYTIDQHPTIFHPYNSRISTSFYTPHIS